MHVSRNVLKKKLIVSFQEERFQFGHLYVHDNTKGLEMTEKTGAKSKR